MLSRRLGLRILLRLLFAAAGLQPAIAADASDNAAEREMLAAVTRQLELLDRFAEHAAATAPQERLSLPLRLHAAACRTWSACAGVRD